MHAKLRTDIPQGSKVIIHNEIPTQQNMKTFRIQQTGRKVCTDSATLATNLPNFF